MKRLNKKRIAIVVILALSVITIGIVFVPKLLKKEVEKPKEEEKIENEISTYGYNLVESKTELYKEYFKELESILKEEEVDEEKYASSVVKLFVADFYDLNSKSSKNDVGGVQFIFDKSQENFLINAKDTIYKYLENNISGDRSQSLPTVKSVVIDSVEKTNFTYNQDSITDESAYKIKATWEYNEDLGYMSEATFILMHQEKKLVIVEIK